MPQRAYLHPERQRRRAIAAAGPRARRELLRGCRRQSVRRRRSQDGTCSSWTRSGQSRPGCAPGIEQGALAAGPKASPGPGRPPSRGRRRRNWRTAGKVLELAGRREGAQRQPRALRRRKLSRGAKLAFARLSPRGDGRGRREPSGGTDSAGLRLGGSAVESRHGCAPARSARRRAGGRSRRPAGAFPGCTARRVPRSGTLLEFWDAATETAWVAGRPPRITRSRRGDG